MLLLQVHILVDNLDTANTNSVNLRAALSAAPLFHEDLFAKICSLSYMGDLRVLVAENKNKVKKIVQGQFDFFRSICRAINEVIIGSREEAAKCMQKVLRQTVMVSSARQAVYGLLAVGGINATRYLANKMRKAWKSWT
ncbi:hypothetical protein Patl1_12122 [Pistacia atlantica]|uniref:Uncharacterized protein n=1 Tax=Pistacia atlantica TaxID=434234 RepID=A0ACC1A7P6_9ROSI|nr:hypothetical protein Patl1_12122 [Pistacia atlantica]